MTQKKFQIRTSQAQFERWKAAAEKHGLSVSEWVRRILDHNARRDA